MKKILMVITLVIITTSVFASTNKTEQIKPVEQDSATISAVLENILSTELPLFLQKSLKKNYENYWITDLFRLTGDEGVCYYITLKNADETLILESRYQGNWHLFKKHQTI
ncbi:MAG TPA: hypothetical protein VF476_05685 [Chitinophagaceae bacterium]